MVTQEWKDKELDKDLLIRCNKEYSPITCTLLHEKVNSFILDRKGARGKYLIGASLDKRCNKYQSRCGNPFTGKDDSLGYFISEIEAHLAWKKYKHQMSCLLADSEYVTDERISEVLQSRYKNYNIIEDHLK